jgi:hypothetical protein
MNFNFIFLSIKYFFNGILIDSDLSIKNFFKNTYGLKNRLLNIIQQRIENNSNDAIQYLNKNEIDQFLTIIYKIVPYNSSLFNRFKLNICLLDFSSCYKG